MRLSPRETEKLLLFLAGELAEKRKARGLKLNYPEAIALISSRLLEPGEEKEVELVTFGGNQKVHGFSNLTEGVTTDIAIKEAAIKRAKEQGFKF